MDYAKQKRAEAAHLLETSTLSTSWKKYDRARASATRIVAIIAFTAIAVAGSSAALAQTSDTSPPQLVSLSLGSNSIDASTGAVTIPISARITDSLSGLNYLYASYTSIVEGVYRSFTSYFADYNRVSGTNSDGIYQTDLVIPQYAAQGTYDLSIGGSDKASNYFNVSGAAVNYLGTANRINVSSAEIPLPGTAYLFAVGAAMMLGSYRQSLKKRSKFTHDVA